MSIMKKLTTRNVGGFDRVLRALPFVGFLYAFASGALTGVPLIAFGVVSAMLLLTSVTGMCSIYAMLGLSTCKARS